MGESVSFTSGYAVQGFGDSSVAANVAAANIDCLPEDLDCLRATIFAGELEGANATAGVEVVAAWDGHVSLAWAGHGSGNPLVQKSYFCTPAPAASRGHASPPASLCLQGHGTHVSGTAMGSQFGVAKKATIHAVKTMGDDGSGSYSNIIAGTGSAWRLVWMVVDAHCCAPDSCAHDPPCCPPAGMSWVVQHVKRNGWRGVVNMSLGE